MIIRNFYLILFILFLPLFYSFFVPFSVQATGCKGSYNTTLSCSFGPPNSVCDTYDLAAGWAAVGTPACSGQSSVTQVSCDGCDTEADAKACACGGGGSHPNCSIDINQSSVANGYNVKFQLNARNSGFVGNTYFVQQPTVNGSGCGTISGSSCSTNPNTNLCGGNNSCSSDVCQNVCQSGSSCTSYPFSFNISGSSSVCTINWAVKDSNNNIGYCSTTAGSGAANSCTATPPSGGLDLSKPADGGTISDTTPKFEWSAVNNWGKGCKNDNSYTVRLYGLNSAAKNCLGNHHALAASPVTNTSATWPGAFALCDGKYQWWVTASNGAYSFDSETRTFTVCASGSCSAVSSSYFQTLGGDVVALDELDNRQLPAGKYLSDNLLGQANANSAGIVFGAPLDSFTAVAPNQAYYSKQTKGAVNSTVGWNINWNSSPSVSDIDKISYDSMLKAALNHGGLSGISDVCSAPNQTVTVSRNGKTFTYKCYSGNPNLSWGTSGNTLVLVPSGSATTNYSLSTVPTAGSNVILFADQGVDVGSSITMANNSTQLIMVVDGNVNLTSPNGTSRLDGVILADTIDTGVTTNNTALIGVGMIYGRNQVNLSRQLNTVNPPASETFTYEPRYLNTVQTLLVSPKIKWQQLPGI